MHAGCPLHRAVRVCHPVDGAAWSAERAAVAPAGAPFNSDHLCIIYLNQDRINTIMRRFAGSCVVAKAIYRDQFRMLGFLSTSELKREWRKKIMTELIQNKTLEDCKEAGLMISKYLQSMDAFRAAQTVSVFISKFPEIDTDPIVREILGSKKTCLLPTWRKSVMKMIPVSEHEYDSLIGQRKNSQSIPMPLFDHHETYDKPIDIVIMPGLVLSKNGTRIGYGFGYYDRYLNNLAKSPYPKPLLIGVCHESQLVDAALPSGSFDHLVDMIISPSGITLCRAFL